MKYYKENKVLCKVCGDTISYMNISKQSNPGSMIFCKCGAVGLDPSACMYRIVGDEASYTDLSVEWDDTDGTN